MADEPFSLYATTPYKVKKILTPSERRWFLMVSESAPDRAELHEAGMHLSRDGRTLYIKDENRALEYLDETVISESRPYGAGTRSLPPSFTASQPKGHFIFNTVEIAPDETIDLAYRPERPGDEDLRSRREQAARRAMTAEEFRKKELGPARDAYFESLFQERYDPYYGETITERRDDLRFSDDQWREFSTNPAKRQTLTPDQLRVLGLWEAKEEAEEVFRDIRAVERGPLNLQREMDSYARGAISESRMQTRINSRKTGRDDTIVYRGIPSGSSAGTGPFNSNIALAHAQAGDDGVIEAIRLTRDESSEFFPGSERSFRYYRKDPRDAEGVAQSRNGLDYNIPEDFVDQKRAQGQILSTNISRPSPVLEISSVGMSREDFEGAPRPGLVGERPPEYESPMREREAARGAATADTPDTPELTAEQRRQQQRIEEKAGELRREIYEQERRLSDLNPDSRSGREARARVKAARAALRGLGRLAAVAAGVGTVMEGVAYAQDVAEEGPVGGTRKYIGEGIEGTGALASGVESLTERESVEEQAGLPASGMTRAMRLGGDVAGAFGRGMGAVGRAIVGSDEEKEPIRGSAAEMRRQAAARAMERERARKE